MKFEARIEDNNSMNFPYYWKVSEEGNETNYISGTATTPRAAKRRIKKAAKFLKEREVPYMELWWFEL